MDGLFHPFHFVGKKVILKVVLGGMWTNKSEELTGFTGLTMKLLSPASQSSQSGFCPFSNFAMSRVDSVE